MPSGDSARISAFEFEELVRSIIARQGKLVKPEGPSFKEVDIISQEGDRVHFYEVKHIPPQTHPRLQQVVNQLKSHEHQFLKENPDKPPPRLTLVVSSSLSPRNREFLSAHDISVMGAEEIARAALQHGLQREARRFFGDTTIDPIAHTLLMRIDVVRCGWDDWALYQKLCQDILEYLFCPPLERPIAAHRT
ncbi:hypothetical protein GCM10027161_38850 [Microbispora hainanensis]